MRNSTAYFAGVATVFSATALGFGGALIVTNATAPQSGPEQTRLERNLGSPAQAALPEPKTTSSDGGRRQAQDTNRSGGSTPPAVQQPVQQGQATSQPPEQAAQGQTQAQTTAPPPAAVTGQSATSGEAKPPANAYARASDQNIKKYIRKRERRWAHRNHDDSATSSAQLSNSDSSNPESASTSQVTSGTSAQSGPERQAERRQTKPTDQTAGRPDGVDSGKSRKRDRRWARDYLRDDGGRMPAYDRSRSLEVREIPSEDAPRSPFSMPRWQPFFSDSDDD